MVAPPIPSEIAAQGPTERKRAHHLRALTGLRFVAAVLVVMFHFLTIHVPSGPGPWHLITQTAAHVVASGYTGVSFFFVLSGFILAYTYIDAQGRMSMTGRGFWRARFARIYPAFFLASALAIVPYAGWGAWHAQWCVGAHPLVAGNNPLVTVLDTFSLMQAWLPCAMTWNAPGWSLSVEAFFYLLFPLIALAMARLHRSHLLIAAIAFWALSLVAALVYIALSLDASAMHVAWWERYWTWVFYTNPVLRLPEFLFGVALGRYFLSRRSTARPPRAGLARHLSPRNVSLLAVLGIVITWCIGPLPLILFNQVVLDPLYALLIYCLAFEEGPVARVFALPAVVLLGEVSYGVYILHWPIRNMIGHFLPHLPLGTPPFLAPSTVYFLVYLCVVIAVSILSFRFVEQPARRLINRALGGRRDTPVRAPMPTGARTRAR